MIDLSLLFTDPMLFILSLMAAIEIWSLKQTYTMKGCISRIEGWIKGHTEVKKNE